MVCLSTESMAGVPTLQLLLLLLIEWNRVEKETPPTRIWTAESFGARHSGVQAEMAWMNECPAVVVCSFFFSLLSLSLFMHAFYLL